MDYRIQRRGQLRVQCRARKPAERSQGLQTSGNVSGGIGVDRATTALVAGIHRRQQVTDLGATDLADH